MSRRIIVGSVILASGLAVSACGGGSSNATSSEAPSSAPASASSSEASETPSPTSESPTPTPTPTLDLPGSPTNVVAVAGRGTITVKWKAPKSDGGQALSGFSASVIPGGQECAAPAGKLVCKITGLDDGTSYQVYVSSLSEAGASEPSAGVKVKTLPTPPKVYEQLSKRDWALILKAPDDYVGKTYVIYGDIYQFDAATGTDGFLAHASYEDTLSYGYFTGDNAVFRGSTAMLKKFVEGDVFKAKVTVGGSYSYDTQAGGNTTVPDFTIDSITQIGSSD